MVIFEALDAEYGDCLLLHYALNFEGQKIPQLWLIDGGPPRVWENTLCPHLAGMAQDGPLRIRLAMVTHIDSDHIGGLKNMAAALTANPRGQDTPDLHFVDFWFNGFERILGPAPAVIQTLGHGGLAGGKAFLESAREGEQLLNDLKALGVPLNAGFDQGRIEAPKTLSLGPGVDIRLLAPTGKRIEALRQEWARQMRTPVAQLAAALVAAEKRDASPTNLSSLAFLATVQGRTILFTGDALADDLIAGWTEQQGSDPCPIDVMKVPHHGAAGNNSMDLFRLFPARHYVFCANGRHHNPDRQTLEWLIETQTGRDYLIHMTSESGSDGLQEHEAFLNREATGKVVWRKAGARSIRIEL